MMQPKRLRPGDGTELRWCISMAYQKYPPFDHAAALAWGEAALANDDVAIFVTESCFALAVVYQRFYAPAKRFADLVLLCNGRSDKRGAGQLMALARAIRDWAVERGCARLDFAAETHCDLGPLARRVGLALQQAAWMVQLPAKAA